MILAETWYKTHDDKLLAIIEASKIWHHYLKNCKYKMLVLTDYNNLCCFMDTKSLSSRWIYWAQELFWYYFRIDYCQSKANAAADTLSRFPHKNQDKNNEFWAENSQIFYCLQNSLTNASLVELNFPSSLLSHLHQALICRTYVLS